MESDIVGDDDVDVFVGVDVGKGEHHAVAIDLRGKRLFDRPLPNDEARRRDLIGGLKKHGRVLFVVDQPATIGALPVAVAHAEGVLVGYLAGQVTATSNRIRRLLTQIHPRLSGVIGPHLDHPAILDLRSAQRR